MLDNGQTSGVFYTMPLIKLRLLRCLSIRDLVTDKKEFGITDRLHSCQLPVSTPLEKHLPHTRVSPILLFTQTVASLLDRLLASNLQ